MVNRLQLNRPLVSIDLETTGLNPQMDKIVEISCVKIFPDFSREIYTRRLNPERPIPQSASVIHGIVDADVAHEAGIPLIIDNAYGVPFPGMIYTEAEPVWNENLIVCMTLSKFGLPAVRTGIVVANREI